jgi:hypothetical protein
MSMTIASRSGQANLDPIRRICMHLATVVATS